MQESKDKYTMRLLILFLIPSLLIRKSLLCSLSIDNVGPLINDHE